MAGSVKYKGVIGHRGGGGSPYVMFLGLSDYSDGNILKDWRITKASSPGIGVTTSLISGEIIAALSGIMSSYPRKCTWALHRICIPGIECSPMFAMVFENSSASQCNKLLRTGPCQCRTKPSFWYSRDIFVT